MNRNRIAAISLAVLALAAVMSFGTGTKENAGAAANGPKLTITYWMDLPADKVAPVYKNMGDTALYQELERRTGVHVTFMHPPVGQAADQFNLIVASRDLPDVMERDLAGTYPGGPQKALADGVTINHTDLINNYAPNLKALYAQHPFWAKLAKTDDGTYYGFPFIRGADEIMVFFGPQFRKDYLDKVGMKVPVTIDDWHQTLKAFKDQLGIKYPFSFRQKGVNQDGNDLFTGFTAAGSGGEISGAWGVTRGFYLGEDGKVKYGPAEAGWKGFLQTMAQWYSEGLIDADFAVQDLKTQRAKIMNGDAGAYIGYAGGGMGYYYDNMKASNPGFTLVGAPYPVLTAGQKGHFGQKDWDVSQPAVAFITPKNQHPKETAAWLDYGYGKDGYMLFNFGIEGKSYTMDNNYPKYTPWITKNPDGKPMAIAMSTYMRSHYNGPFVQAREYFEQFMAYSDQVAAVKTWTGSSDFASRLPPVTATPDESTKLAAIMNEIYVYTDEMFIKFIMGQANIDEQWDSYVAQVKKMGIGDALAIEEAALVRFNKR